MFTGDFWVRIYDLPLKLRSNAMAVKLGNTIGNFIEVDSNESNRLGKFLRVKATIDLRKPLKRGTVITFQGKALRVFFKYERLPTFYYVCGRIGHQIKDYDEVGGKEDEDYEDTEEKELPYGSWLKTSPIPKFSGDIKKDQNSGLCSKSLFSEASTNKEGPKGKGAKDDGGEVEVVNKEMVPKPVNAVDGKGTHSSEKSQTEVESVAESLGNVVLSTLKLTDFDMGSNTKPRNSNKAAKKWSRKKTTRKKEDHVHLIADMKKRNLVEVEIFEGGPMDLCKGEKKRRNEILKDALDNTT